MQIFVRGNEIKSINVDSTQSVAEFKATVAKTFDLRDVTQMNLYLNGAPLQQLNDEMNQQTIDLDIGLIGGKVHGSLARAGKVKGQTPKVSKGEENTKKKPLTGRAKRRLQYNRRFVNVVVGPGGRRKGPNANAGGQASQT